jgi:hypothetical protein
MFPVLSITIFREHQYLKAYTASFYTYAFVNIKILNAYTPLKHLCIVLCMQQTLITVPYCNNLKSLYIYIYIYIYKFFYHTIKIRLELCSPHLLVNFSTHAACPTKLKFSDIIVIIFPEDYS